MNCATVPVQASPEFWCGLWKTMQEDLRRRIRSSRSARNEAEAEWVDSSVLLRVMEGPVEMFRIVPKVFLHKSGRLLVSVRDFALLEIWGNAGIEPAIVRHGIREMFDKYCGRQINSIAFCGPAVLQCASNAKEASIGCHREPSRLVDQTLLIGLPRKGSLIYKAVARREMMEQLARTQYGLGLALTVQPDEWERGKLPHDFLQPLAEVRA